LPIDHTQGAVISCLRGALLPVVSGEGLTPIMDITFSCKNCSQQLEIDKAGAGRTTNTMKDNVNLTPEEFEKEVESFLRKTGQNLTEFKVVRC
jgi:hypothetical protein